jgi:hypothetical protein
VKREVVKAPCEGKRGWGRRRSSDGFTASGKLVGAFHEYGPGKDQWAAHPKAMEAPQQPYRERKKFK